MFPCVPFFSVLLSQCVCSCLHSSVLMYLHVGAPFWSILLTVQLSLPLPFALSLPISVSLLDSRVSLSLSLCFSFPSPFLPSLPLSFSVLWSLAGVVHSELLSALCWVYVRVFGNKHPYPASHRSSLVLLWEGENTGEYSMKT